MTVLKKAKVFIASLALAVTGIGGIAVAGATLAAPAEAASCQYSQDHYNSFNYNCPSARHYISLQTWKDYGPWVSRLQTSSVPPMCYVERETGYGTQTG